MNIDKENLGRLSDQDLFKALKFYGINPGPVTATTRNIYEKKLRNAIEKGGVLDSTLNTTSNQLNNSTTTTTTTTSTSRTPTRQSSRRVVETLEPAFKSKENTKESDDANNFEISITNGTQEPILKVSNSNASKIIIEKTTTTITTTPKQPPITTTTTNVINEPVKIVPSATSTQEPYRNFNTRSSDSPANILPNITNRNSGIFTNPDEFRSSSRLSDAISSSSTTTSQVLNPAPTYTFARPSVTTSMASSVPSPIPKRDKYAERLDNYGLLSRNTDEDNIVTLKSRMAPTTTSSVSSAIPTSLGSTSSTGKVTLTSPTNIRSRQPLHPERNATSSYGYTSYSDKPKTQTVAENSPTTIVKPNSGINWRLIGLVALVTAVAYVFIMYIQSNPENPLN